MRTKFTTILMAAAVVATACGNDSAVTTPPGSTTSTPSTVLTTSEMAASTTASTTTTTSETPRATSVIDTGAALTQTVDAAFDPPFTILIPADWTGVLRDKWAFQAYFGNEDFEITFDHTYQEKESVDTAISRLAATAGLDAGPASTIVVGGLTGRSFVGESDAAVRFLDSGFHTNHASRLEIAAIPMDDGTTVTVFLTVGADPELGLDALRELARRIFETVQWT